MGPSPSNGRRRLLVLVSAAVAGAAADTVTAQQGPPTGPGPSYFDPKNFNPSMAVVMVVLVTAFFLLGFFSIYLRRCAGPPLGGPDEYPAGGRRPGIAYASRSRRARGLDRAVLESFPTMAYADVRAHRAGKGELECAVCLSEFDDDKTLRLVPRCAHAFHAGCIDAWLASHVTCPVCRGVLAPDYEAPAPPLAPAGVVPAAEQDAPAVPVPQQPAEEPATAPEQAVVVVVDAEETEEERIRREEAAELMRIGSVKRALRSKSHTTGHSLAGPAAAESSHTCWAAESGRLSRRATFGGRRASRPAATGAHGAASSAPVPGGAAGSATPVGGPTCRCWRAPAPRGCRRGAPCGAARLTRRPRARRSPATARPWSSATAGRAHMASPSLLFLAANQSG